MKRIITLAIVAIIATTVSAQTQQGYVKTKGRLSSTGKVIKGTPLSGAIVQVRGRNSVMSGGNGTFSLSIPSGSFSLESVKKQGYVLNDPDILSKTYSLSKNPLVLVLDNVQQRNEERKAIERKVRSSLWADLNRRDAEIESLKEQNKITEERYRELRQLLTAYEDENQNIIDDMVERYSKIDYDELDNFNLEISNYILNGELLKADSLLKTKGDVHVRADEYHHMREQIAKEEEALAERNKKLEKSKEVAKKKLEDTARDCYSWYEIYKMKHMNDSAAYYLEMRAELDTTNVEWQIQEAKFLEEYLGAFSNAIRIYQSMISSNAIVDSATIALCYNNIGSVYAKMDKFHEALENIDKSLRLRLKLFGFESDEVANCYANLSYIYNRMDRFGDAINACKKSIDIMAKIDGKKYKLATNYNTLGGIYKDTGDYSQSLECYENAIKIISENSDGTEAKLATYYNNIAGLYSQQGDISKALYNYERVLDIFRSQYGDAHYTVAIVYENIASCYRKLSHFQESKEYFEKSLEILHEIYGNNHTEVANLYFNLGQLEVDKSNYNEGLADMQQALNIYANINGMENSDVARCLFSIANILISVHNFDKALELHRKALAIRLALFGEDNIFVAESYEEIASIYSQQKDFALASEYLEKVKKIYVPRFGVESLQIISLFYKYGQNLCNQKNYNEALDYYRRIVDIYSNKQYEDKHFLAVTYNQMCNAYYHTNKLDSAFYFVEKAKELNKNKPTALSVNYQNIAAIYEKNGDYDNAIDNYKKSIALKEQAFGINSDEVCNVRAYLYALLQNNAMNSTIKEKAFADFMAEHIFVERVSSKKVQAAELGLEGNYYLLELNDWTLTDGKSLVDANKQSAGKPKRLLYMKNDIIEEYYFDERPRGTSILLFYVGKEEKERILKIYDDFKQTR